VDPELFQKAKLASTRDRSPPVGSRSKGPVWGVGRRSWMLHYWTKYQHSL